VYANEKHYREFCSWSSFSLFLSLSLSALVDRRAAIHPDETQGRDFGLHSEHVRWPNASRILSEITHSRPKRCSGTTPAVRAFWPHARDYYFFAGWVASLACNPFAVSEREDCISACKRLSDSPKLILHLFISYIMVISFILRISLYIEGFMLRQNWSDYLSNQSALVMRHWWDNINRNFLDSLALYIIGHYT